MPCGWRACRLCRVRSGSLHPRRVPPPPWRPDVLQATQTQHRQSRVRLLRPHPSPGRPVVGRVTFDPSRCLMSAATHYFYLFPASLKTPLPLRHVGPLGPHRPAHPASPAPSLRHACALRAPSAPDASLQAVRVPGCLQGVLRLPTPRGSTTPQLPPPHPGVLNPIRQTQPFLISSIWPKPGLQPLLASIPCQAQGFGPRRGAHGGEGDAPLPRPRGPAHGRPHGGSTGLSNAIQLYLYLLFRG